MSDREFKIFDDETKGYIDGPTKLSHLFNVTDVLSQVDRAALFYNSPDGILINGDNVKPYHRRFFSRKIVDMDGAVYRSTGEIYHINSRYYIAYRLAPSPVKDKEK